MSPLGNAEGGAAMKSIYAAVCRAETAIAGTFLVLMVLLIFLGGIARLEQDRF